MWFIAPRTTPLVLNVVMWLSVFTSTLFSLKQSFLIVVTSQTGPHALSLNR
jgi:hypothetical protein